ncbi:MAG: hypothetical protein J0I84_13915 [Terrimonas sp.]|nr:hypothetical protein [Terrimonas sp.]OJY99118.1 MAG: hypothetical protein BGP13_24030 [Sphingobacteriales bacterium 40-81]
MKIIHRHEQPQINRYPFKNRSLADIKGEQWKPIDGFDEVFWISNKGRVKACARLIQKKSGGSYWIKEKIIGQNFQKTLNKFTGDYTYQLYTGVVYEGRRCRFNIRRLVYHHFVSPLPENENSDTVVSTKNGDGLNCRANNLTLISISARQKKIFTNQRGESAFKKLTVDERKKIIEKNTSRMLAVKQYNIDGKLLNQYKSITLAAKKSGTNLAGICLSAGKKMKFAGGFVWRYDNDFYNGEYKNIARYRKIVQYNLAGKKIKTYSSLNEAATAAKANKNYIMQVLKGTGKQAGGFVWRYEGEAYNGEFSDVRIKRARKIEMLSLSGKLIKRYISIAEASRQTGVDGTCIVMAARGSRKHAGNFLWRYAD